MRTTLVNEMFIRLLFGTGLRSEQKDDEDRNVYAGECNEIREISPWSLEQVGECLLSAREAQTGLVYGTARYGMEDSPSNNNRDGSDSRTAEDNCLWSIIMQMFTVSDTWDKRRFR